MTRRRLLALPALVLPAPVGLGQLDPVNPFAAPSALPFQYLLERDRLGFVLAGAELSEADKAKLMALNQEESKLTTAFNERVLAATNAGAVVVGDRKQLAGLSAGDLASADADGKQRKLEGK